MPCTYDGPEATHFDHAIYRAAPLLVYVREAMNQPIVYWVRQYTHKLLYSGTQEIADGITSMLCEACRNMTEDQKQKIIYDGRNPNARKLADWWEEHQEADRKREAKEAKAAADAAIRKAALAKLTAEERRVLKL